MIKKLGGLSLLAAFLVGLAAPAMADTSSTVSRADRKTIDVACIQSAVSKRDGAVSAAVAAYASAITSAITARTAALNAAWALTGKDRTNALRAAWKAYRASAQAARKTMQNARRDAWKQFNADRKSCNAGNISEPGGGEGADAGL